MTKRSYRRVYLGYSSSGFESMMTEWKYGDRITNGKKSKLKMLSLNSQSPPPVSCFLPQDHISLTSLQNVTNYGPSIQIPETVGVSNDPKVTQSTKMGKTWLWEHELIILCLQSWNRERKYNHNNFFSFSFHSSKDHSLRKWCCTYSG